MVNRFSYFIALIALLGSFLIFFNDTGEFFGSLMAAILTASLVWMAYVLFRWFILALKK